MRTSKAALVAAVVAALSLAAARPASAEDKEEGFVPLFNGKDFGGWKLRKGGESLEGKTEAPKKRFQVADGKIVIDGKTKGDVVIDSAREFGKDVTIRFEFLPGAGCNNDLYFRGAKFDIKKGLKAMKDGEWNDLEIAVKGDAIEFKVNGKLEQKGKVKPAATPLGVRAEFGAIEIRKVRYKEGS